ELQKVDLLKLDCEGSEYEIIYNLPDSSMEKIIALVMETHEGTKENQNHHAMCVYLRRKGFKVKSDNKSMIWSWK
ncbi:MAG: FkbM family methyltransferase, partial [Bacteroidetes bacterium]|nr:FkbM family methyltransferase [Bacteroidota bacterium]